MAFALLQLTKPGLSINPKTGKPFGKSPRFGQQTKAAYLETLRGRAEEYMRACRNQLFNVGLPMGINRLVAIDIDCCKSGVLDIAILKHGFSWLEGADNSKVFMLNQSQSGAYHIILRTDLDCLVKPQDNSFFLGSFNNGEFGNKIDLMCRGGFVVYPPSR